MRRVLRIHRGNSGQGLLDFVLVISLVAIVLSVALTIFLPGANDLFASFMTAKVWVW
jgi:hypothetical protein